MKVYGLCPSPYLYALALSCDAMSKMKKFGLEFITDADIFFFFEKGMRGETLYIWERNSKIKNKHLKSYNPKQELKHVLYLDTDNLNGYAMSKFLLSGEFKWIDPKNFDSNKCSTKISKCFTLEFDKK